MSKRIGRPPEDIVSKLDKKIVTGWGCWKWTASVDKDGYGRIGHYRAFNVVYKLVVGEVPEGLILDHRYNNPECTNPNHLKPVPPYENLMRGNSPSAKNARKTHCKRGHPLFGDNLKLVPAGRQCRECGRMHSREYEKRRPGRSRKR